MFNIVELTTDDSVAIDCQDLGGGPIQVDEISRPIDDECRSVKTIDYRCRPVAAFACGGIGPHRDNSTEAIPLSRKILRPSGAVVVPFLRGLRGRRPKVLAQLE